MDVVYVRVHRIAFLLLLFTSSPVYYKTSISHVSVNLQLTPLLDIRGIRLLRGNNPSSSSASKNSSSSNESTSRIPLSRGDMNVASSSVGKNYNHTICH